MTLLRICGGFSLGLLLGILIAVPCKAIPVLEELFSPIISLIKTVPVVCFVVLFLIWWGHSFLSVAISFLMVFSTIFFSTLEGLKAVKRDMIEMADVFRLPFMTRVLTIYRPALKPFLLGSLKTSLGLAWLAFFFHQFAHMLTNHLQPHHAGVESHHAVGRNHKVM